MRMKPQNSMDKLVGDFRESQVVTEPGAVTPWHSSPIQIKSNINLFWFAFMFTGNSHTGKQRTLLPHPEPLDISSQGIRPW